MVFIHVYFSRFACRRKLHDPAHDTNFVANHIYIATCGWLRVLVHLYCDALQCMIGWEHSCTCSVVSWLGHQSSKPSYWSFKCNLPCLWKKIQHQKQCKCGEKYVDLKRKIERFQIGKVFSVNALYFIIKLGSPKLHFHRILINPSCSELFWMKVDMFLYLYHSMNWYTGLRQDLFSFMWHHNHSYKSVSKVVDCLILIWDQDLGDNQSPL